MDEKKFTLTCNFCGNELELKNSSYIDKIRLGESIAYDFDIIITCQRCGNSIKVRK